jgi:hypothetical protein
MSEEEIADLDDYYGEGYVEAVKENNNFQWNKWLSSSEMC